jgi:diadenosine tetraphosphatase ApaH/serine/threonine PP2A family protein phosphatase
MDAFAALERVETAGAETLFCGHTHRPYVRELRDGSNKVRVRQASDGAAESEREMQLPMRRIINAGSVGEPRHGNPHATYVIHEEETDAVEIREVTLGFPFNRSTGCGFSMDGPRGRARGWVDVRG